MKQEILLSISIMVSGREETTEKCISSLDQLRKSVPCELILTDTGCSETMRTYLEEKADKVITFEWCNDFAAARNAGLNVAVGKWFLFVDDDEWFEDTTQIERFFISGEYQRYQSATYIVRNYAQKDGSVWKDTSPARMTRRRPETRFFYPIHEVLWPVLEPQKHLEDYAHHYGYASDNPEVQEKKRQRNLSLLLPAIRQDPHCMHHYIQAVGEYIAVKDWENALQFAYEGIRQCDPSREENGNHIHALYAAVIKLLSQIGRYGEACREGRRFLTHAKLSELAQATICCELVFTCEQVGKEQKGLDYLEQYLRWKMFFTENREIRLQQETKILDSCFEDYSYSRALASGFAMALSQGKFEFAEELLERENTEWWCRIIQKWYGRASENSREQWKGKFTQLANCCQSHSKAAEIYGILTQPDENAEQANFGEQTGEMQALAAQLKGKIRLLIEQGQTQAAWQTVVQLRNFFPNDDELKQWQSDLEREINNREEGDLS